MSGFAIQYQKSKPFELLSKGKYPFEVVAADKGIQAGNGITRGCDKFDLRVALFRDIAALQRGEYISGPNKRLEIRASLIAHENCYGMVSAFLESVGFFDGTQKEGQEFKPEAEDLVGLRGWCEIDHEEDKSDASKKYLRVKYWVTDKEPLPRKSAAPVAAETKTNDPWA